MAADTYDYIIVGAGTAGCLLANRLSADPQARVLLLEAGGKDNYHWIHIPVGYLYLMGNPRTDWGFKTAAEPGLNGRSLELSARQGAGRLLVHQRHDLHARPGARLRSVAADGQSRLGLGRRAALLQEAPGPVGGGARTRSSGLHARGGEWRIEQPRIRWEILDAFRDAAARGRHSQGGGLQPRRQRGLRLLPRQPEDRRALEHLQGVPAPRAPPAQPRRSRRTRRSSGWCSTASG